MMLQREEYWDQCGVTPRKRGMKALKMRKGAETGARFGRANHVFGRRGKIRILTDAIIVSEIGTLPRCRILSRRGLSAWA